MQRAQNTHADVNSAFLVKVNKNDKFRVLETPNIVFGGINTNFVRIFRIIINLLSFYVFYFLNYVI